jgi:hypothetical protein
MAKMERENVRDSEIDREEGKGGVIARGRKREIKIGEKRKWIEREREKVVTITVTSCFWHFHL